MESMSLSLHNQSNHAGMNTHAYTTVGEEESHFFEVSLKKDFMDFKNRPPPNL